MTFLLDTAAFWWMASGDQHVPPPIRNLFNDPAHDMLLSPISLWELLVKHQQGKLPTPAPLSQLFSQTQQRLRLTSLLLTNAAVLRLPSLPSIHRDPFDRLLICQALDANATILTPDTTIRSYPVPTLW